MKKFILTLVTFLVTIGAAQAATTLWEYYNGNLPSFLERTKIYESKFNDVYLGTAEQNTKLLNQLQSPVFLGAFGDPFISLQLATDPDNGECLTTDGTDNVWSSSCGSSGGVGTSTHPFMASWFVATSTTATSTFAGGLTVDGTSLVVDYSSGNVGIGTAAPNNKLTVYNASGAIIDLETSESAVGGDDPLGGIEFRGLDTTVLHQTGAKIMAVGDNTWGGTANDAPTRLEFYTQSDGTGDGLALPSMVIKHSGLVGIGTTSPYAKLSVKGGGTSTGRAFAISDSADTELLRLLDNGTLNVLSATATSTFAGGLSVTGTGINFGTDTRFYQNNTAFLTSSSTSAGNLTVGYGAAPSIDAQGGLYSTYIGYQAGATATSSKYNTAVGYQALNKVVNSGATLGNYNTAEGYRALYSNTTGYYNSAQGVQALYSNTTGYRNSAQGYVALRYNTTGIGNVGVGYYTGIGVGDTNPEQRSVIDNYSTFLGYNAGRDGIIASTTALTGSSAIGYNARVGSSYAMALGGMDGYSINVGVGTSSPWARLSVAGKGGATTPLFTISSSTSGFATSTAFIIDSNGKVGVGTTTPWTQLSVIGNGYFSNSLYTGDVLSCSEALETDATGKIVCGSDQTATGAANPFAWANNYNVLAAATTSPLWLQGSPSLMASSTAYLNDIKVTSNSTSTIAGGLNITGGGLTIGNIAGFLKATAGAITTSLISLTTDVTGTLGIANGGTNNTSFSTNSLVAYNGTALVSTSTSPLYIGSVFATTTTATSTFKGGVGIGTTTPAAPLGVNGDVYINGKIRGATFDKSFNISSTTPDSSYNMFSTATSTFVIWNPKNATILSSLYCKTTNGSATVALGNGSASSTVVATTAGVESTSVVSFAARGDVYAALKGGTANSVTCTITAYNQ